jgi:hypothetical protein
MLDAAQRYAALAYYERIGAALFPIPAGSKNPTGIVGSFAQDWSRDPAQWAAWSDAHNCNFGLVAGPSRFIIMDTDVNKAGRDAAWAARCELFVEWGMNPATPPHIQSARGGWHDIFQVPADVDAATLRQPDAIKKLINIRAGNGFVVAAGSYYDGTAKGEDSGHYVLLTDGPPHVAPQALIAHCTRVSSKHSSGAVIGTRDAGDIAGMVKWLAERDAFDAYEDWLGAGMALKVEMGDSGRDVWAFTHNDTVDSDTEATKWNSFASEPTSGSQTLNSLMQRAHQLGWSGTIRKSTESMFGNLGAVAQLAAAAGASLSPAPGGVPMLAGQAVLSDIGAPILAEFLAATADAPLRPAAADFPTLPEPLSGHALFGALRDTCARIVAMSEPSFAWKPSRVVHVAAVLMQVQPDTAKRSAAGSRRTAARGRAPRSSLRPPRSRNRCNATSSPMTNGSATTKAKSSRTTPTIGACFSASLGAKCGSTRGWNGWKSAATSGATGQ